MMSLWSGYLSLLERRPLMTKCATSAVLYVTGDVLAQNLDGTIKKKGYDTRRGITAVVWGIELYFITNMKICRPQ